MGISQPCQVRFIHYFEAFYKGIVKSPQIKYLKKITIFSVPNTAGTFGNIGCKPYFEIYRVLGVHNELIYSNKDNKDQVRFYSRDDGFIQLDLDNLPLFGNILVQFKTVGSISNSNLFRTTFNTAFIGRNNLFEVNRRCISPENLHKDTYTFAEDFFVRFTFEDYCKGEAGTNERRPCRSVETPLNEICDNCTSIMKEEIQHWREAQEILANHDRPSVETAR
jgi:phosphatidylinositol-3,4,5-trisphosphate 3-phosphatase/dual-specificity protein phosphatase PTEN